MSLRRQPTLEELKDALEKTRVALECSAEKIRGARHVLKNKTEWGHWEHVTHIDYWIKLDKEHAELEKKHRSILREIGKSVIYHEYQKVRYVYADLEEKKSQLKFEIQGIEEELHELNCEQLKKNAELMSLQEEKTDANDEKNRWGPLYIKRIEDELVMIEERTQKFLLHKKDSEEDLEKTKVEQTTNEAALHELAMRLCDHV